MMLVLSHSQVIVVALILSFVIKRDSEVIDYEDAFGEMKTVDDITVNDTNIYGTAATLMITA